MDRILTWDIPTRIFPWRFAGSSVGALRLAEGAPAGPRAGGGAPGGRRRAPGVARDARVGAQRRTARAGAAGRTTARIRSRMRHPATVATATGLFLGLALACGGMGSGSGDLSYRKTDYGGAPGADGYPELDRAYRVPPDRAVVAVTVRVDQPTAAAASAQLTAELDALVAATGAACAPELLDATPPTASRGYTGDASWGATAEVRLDVDLRGLATTPERRTKLEACLAALDPSLTQDEWVKSGAGTRMVVRSAPVLAVDQPEAHRDALLDRARARLTWAAQAGGAPQLQPGDLRCVPDGSVIVGDRRLSGVVLELSMPCRVDGAAAGAASAEE